MNFNNVFRWHLPFLFLMLMTFRAAAADTLLILGDSLSAGYRMAASAAPPALLNDKWQSRASVVNGSISGDTSQQGLSRLPALLKQHQPRWVLVELGGKMVCAASSLSKRSKRCGPFCRPLRPPMPSRC